MKRLFIITTMLLAMGESVALADGGVEAGTDAGASDAQIDAPLDATDDAASSASGDASDDSADGADAAVGVPVGIQPTTTPDNLGCSVTRAPATGGGVPTFACIAGVAFALGAVRRVRRSEP